MPESMPGMVNVSPDRGRSQDIENMALLGAEQVSSSGRRTSMDLSKVSVAIGGMSIG